MPVTSPFDIPNLQSELQRLAFIGLGSNLGDAKQNVLRAMDRLQRLSEFPLLRSSLWRTTPVDCPPESPEFVNAVVGLLPPAGESPEGLLDQLQANLREDAVERQDLQVDGAAAPVDAPQESDHAQSSTVTVLWTTSISVP